MLKGNIIKKVLMYWLNKKKVISPPPPAFITYCIYKVISLKHIYERPHALVVQLVLILYSRQPVELRQNSAFSYPNEIINNVRPYYGR